MLLILFWAIWYWISDYETLRALDADNVPSVSSMSDDEINALPVHKYKVAGSQKYVLLAESDIWNWLEYMLLRNVDYWKEKKNCFCFWPLVVVSRSFPIIVLITFKVVFFFFLR